MCGPIPLLAMGKKKAALASLVSPLAGLAVAATSGGKKKKHTPVAAPPILEPTRSLNNSSLFNSSAWGG